MELYVVVGQTGEWEDKITWYVGLDGKITAFEDEEITQDHCARLNYIVRDLGLDVLDDDDEQDLVEYIKETYDENLTVDYTGIYYKVKKLSFCMG